MTYTAKESGIFQGAQQHEREIMTARSLAVLFARANDGICSINDLRRQIKYKGINLNLDGPEAKAWMGSIFDKNWIFDPNGYFRHDGSYRPAYETAIHENAHGRIIRVWKLKEDAQVTVVPIPTKKGPGQQLELIA